MTDEFPFVAPRHRQIDPAVRHCDAAYGWAAAPATARTPLSASPAAPLAAHAAATATSASVSAASIPNGHAGAKLPPQRLGTRFAFGVIGGPDGCGFGPSPEGG